MDTSISGDTASAVTIDINLSQAIKGFAIILMVAHHSFGFPAWYIQGINYSNVVILGIPMSTWVMNSTDLCVSLFAFLTGWAYFFNKKKTLKYSLGKIGNFLKYYWFILLLIFVPAAVVLVKHTFTVKDILFNMFVVKADLVTFAWYVYFYVFAMLTLPFVTKLFRGGILFNFFFAIAYCVTMYNLVSHVLIFRGYITNGLMNCFYWYPCVLVGYLFAQHDLFGRLSRYFKHPNKILYACTLFVVMGCRLKWQTVLNINLDVLYAPAAVFCLAMLLNPGAAVVRKTLEFLGRHAMNIWFLHAIFFSTVTRQTFQKLAYLPRNPVLVVIWIILLCLPFSIAINFIFRQQEKLFRKIKDRRLAKLGS